MSIASALYPQVLAIVFALLFVCTFVTLLTVRQRLSAQGQVMQRMADLLGDQRVAQTEQTQFDIDTLHDQLAGVAGDIKRVAQSQLDLCRSPGGGNMKDAASLARQGLSAEQLADRYAMSQGEAELLVRLHAPDAQKRLQGVRSL